MRMKNCKLVCCPESLDGLRDYIKVFVAGPIQGASKWQHSLPDIPGVAWISPRRLEYEGFNYDEQIGWETLGLRISDIVLFWIPEPIEDIPGRCYSQTTRIELGENLGRGKRAVYGCYSSYPGRSYIEEKIKRYYGEDKFLHPSLDSLLNELTALISTKVHSPKLFFTSDTHFGSSRALDLSRRPFVNVREMDETMIERWNSVVSPYDRVFHLGDFGETLWPISYLNGSITLLLGNYEREGRYMIPEGVDVCEDPILDYSGYIMSHEPGRIKDYSGRKLFGHIHGRQMLKSWNGIDVGVDCNNFTPVSEERLSFYFNAIEKGYYDEEVFC